MRGVAGSRRPGVGFVSAVAWSSAIASVAYWPFFVPALYSDDWNQGLERVVEGSAPWLSLDQVRPALFVPFRLQYLAFGTHVTAWYVLVWSLYLAMTLLLYRIVREALPEGRHAFALAVALLFLVYPTNYAHMWLTALQHASALLLTLVYAWAVLRFARGGGGAYLAAASAALFVSLGVYEGQLGLAAATVIAAAAQRGRASWRRAVLAAAPVLALGTLAVARIAAFRSTSDYYTPALVTGDVGEVARRLAAGFKISLVWGWSSVLEHYGGTRGGVLALAFLGAASAALMAAGEGVSRRWRGGARAGAAGEAGARRRAAGLAPYWAALALGAVLIAAGYIPGALVVFPNLTGFSSRINMCATVGAALCCAAALRIAAGICAAGDGPRANRLALLGAAPLLALGVVAQVSVQQRARVAWHEQVSLWRGVFRAAPDLRDQTLVLLVLPGYEERVRYQTWWRLPLEASWDASAGVRLLYGNRTLQADVVFPDVVRFNEPRLTAAGVRNWQTGEVVPYGRTVAFLYDRALGAVVRLPRLPGKWVEGGLPTDLCEGCVTGGAPVSRFRALLSR